MANNDGGKQLAMVVMEPMRKGRLASDKGQPTDDDN